MNGNPTGSFIQRISHSDILKIVVVNSLIFVILHFTRITYLIAGETDEFFYRRIWSQMTLPATLGEWVYKPWTIITFMFADNSFMQLLGNMIWLWIIGSVIEDLKGAYRILPVYILGGVMGGLLFMTAHTFFPGIKGFSYTGALPSLMGVMAAVVSYKPMYKSWVLFGIGIPVWIFASCYLLIQIATLQSYSISLLFLILGGLITGLLSNFLLQGFFDYLTGQLKRVANYWGNNINFIRKPSSAKTVAKNVPFRTIKYTDVKIDQILDKINEKGMSALTTEEKRMLEEYSKKS
ncbi:MAG: rhomboid family intramembrane serine protease [Chitinophagaceae bacterium]|nr:rhomboid family intramembrane serine protease [Chitinophagaceae bacterium]